jgi:hypothetical protein
MKTINRTEYLEGRISFEEFYREVNRRAGVKLSLDHPMVQAAKKALAEGDRHLNNIPLREWDWLASGASHSLNKALKELGDFYSVAGGVCAMKQAALDAIAGDQP